MTRTQTRSVVPTSQLNGTTGIGRLLAPFGVPSDAEAVWRAMLQLPGADARELAEASGVAAESVPSAFECLEHTTLARPGETPCGLVAIDPTLAIESLIAREERQLAERLESMALVRAGIPDATADYLRSRSDPRSELAIEIINDVGDVRRQIELAAERETSQSRYLGRAVSLEAFRASQPTDLKGLARGVRQRTLLSVAALDDPEVYAGYEGLVALGEQVRTLPEVPTQMLIFDEIMAVLPVDPSDSSAGAIFIRVPSVVSTLAYFFDRLWVDGDPIFERAEDRLAPSGRGARVLELLAVGTKDERIARLLGIGVRTIRRDVAGLKKMLGVSSRTEIVAAAIRKGWL